MTRDQRAFVGRQFTEWVCGVAAVDLVDVVELSFGVRVDAGAPFVIVYGRGGHVLAVVDLAADRIGAGEVKAGTAR